MAYAHAAQELDVDLSDAFGLFGTDVDSNAVRPGQVDAARKMVTGAFQLASARTLCKGRKTLVQLLAIGALDASELQDSMCEELLAPSGQQTLRGEIDSIGSRYTANWDQVKQNVSASFSERHQHTLRQDVELPEADVQALQQLAKREEEEKREEWRSELKREIEGLFDSKFDVA